MRSKVSDAIAIFIFVLWLTLSTAVVQSPELTNDYFQYLPPGGLVVAVGLMLVLPFSTIGDWLNRCSSSRSIKIFGLLSIEFWIFILIACAWNLLVLPMLHGLKDGFEAARVLWLVAVLYVCIIIAMWFATLLTLFDLLQKAAFQHLDKFRKPVAYKAEALVSLSSVGRWIFFFIVVTCLAYPITFHP